MAGVRRICSLEIQQNFNIFKTILTSRTDICTKKYSTARVPLPELPKGRLHNRKQHAEIKELSRYTQIYREFLPDPDPTYRNLLRERLERKDMIARRKVMDIPEFYVGSIVAVTISDIHSPGKTNRFLGICIIKMGSGLRCNFTLRNVIDHQGVEVNYDMYDPTIQLIECIRLEKRLDDNLLYLRDCPEEYSTFPQNMEPEFLPEGAKVPVNDIKVPLNPPPYSMRWEIRYYKGITNLQVGYKRQKRMELKQNTRPWEQFDLMKIYRETIPDEDRLVIFQQVHKDLDLLEKDRRSNMRRLLIDRSKNR